MEESVYSSVLKICSLLTNMSTVKLTLANEYFRTIVTLNRDALSCSYVENDYALALQIILSTSATLDTFCYLQHNFKVVEHIRRLKEDYESSFSGGVIIDKVTLYYEFVLAFVQSIGGDREKRMPRLHIEDEEEVERKLDLPTVDADTAKLEDCLAKLKQNFGQTKEWQSKLKQYINESIENGYQGTVGAFFDEIMMLSMSTMLTERNESTEFPTAHGRQVLPPELELALELFSKYRPNISIDSLKQVCNLHWHQNSGQRCGFHQAHLFCQLFQKASLFYQKKQFFLIYKLPSFSEQSLILVVFSI